MTATAYHVGLVKDGDERTHLIVGPGRAKCGTKLDEGTARSSVDRPACQTCCEYAGIVDRWICAFCPTVVETPLPVVEVWHACPNPPKGRKHRKMKRDHTTKETA